MSDPKECQPEDTSAGLPNDELDAALREAHAINAKDPETEQELIATAERGQTDPD